MPYDEIEMVDFSNKKPNIRKASIQSTVSTCASSSFSSSNKKPNIRKASIQSTVSTCASSSFSSRKSSFTSESDFDGSVYDDDKTNVLFYKTRKNETGIDFKIERKCDKCGIIVNSFYKKSDGRRYCFLCGNREKLNSSSYRAYLPGIMDVFYGLTSADKISVNSTEKVMESRRLDCADFMLKSSLLIIFKDPRFHEILGSQYGVIKGMKRRFQTSYYRAEAVSDSREFTKDIEILTYIPIPALYIAAGLIFSASQLAFDKMLELKDRKVFDVKNNLSGLNPLSWLAVDMILISLRRYDYYKIDSKFSLFYYFFSNILNYGLNSYYLGNLWSKIGSAIATSIKGMSGNILSILASIGLNQFEYNIFEGGIIAKILGKFQIEIDKNFSQTKLETKKHFTKIGGFSLGDPNTMLAFMKYIMPPKNEMMPPKIDSEKYLEYQNYERARLMIRNILGCSDYTDPRMPELHDLNRNYYIHKYVENINVPAICNANFLHYICYINGWYKPYYAGQNWDLKI